MKNRAATWVHLIFAWIIVIGVFLQVYFIASYVTGAGEGALDAHGFTGGLVIHGSELIVFLSEPGRLLGAVEVGRLELRALRARNGADLPRRRPTTTRRAAGCTGSTVSFALFVLVSPPTSRTATCAARVEGGADAAPAPGPPPQLRPSARGALRRSPRAPLEIESYALERLEHAVSSEFTRVTTVVRLRGRRRGGRRRGRDVRGRGSPAAGRPRAASGSHTLDSFSELARRARALHARAGSGRLPRLPPLGVRERRARPGSAAGGQAARLRGRPRARARQLRRLDGPRRSAEHGARCAAGSSTIRACASSSTRAAPGRRSSSPSSSSSAASTSSTSRASTKARWSTSRPTRGCTGSSSRASPTR